MKDLEHVFPFVFPFFFVGMWCLTLRILSFMSGWTRLAGRFQSTETFRGQYYRFQSGRLNQVNFRSALEMGVNKRGLFLVPMILFRVFHKPLLIPWSDIKAEPFKRFMFRGYRLTFRSFPGISLEVYARTFEKMVTYLKTEVGVQ